MIEKRYSRYFIYNAKTRKCISNKLYTDTPTGNLRVKKDLEGIQRLIPTAMLGVSLFDKATRQLIDQDPTDITNVQYPQDSLKGGMIDA